MRASATLHLTATVNPGTGGGTSDQYRKRDRIGSAGSGAGQRQCRGGCDGSGAAATSADLAVTKNVDNANPTEGDTVVYTVTLTNNGLLDATNVSVTDVLPTGLTYSSDDAAASGTSYDSASGLWTVGTLRNGQTQDASPHCDGEPGYGWRHADQYRKRDHVGSVGSGAGEQQCDGGFDSSGPGHNADLAVTKSVDNTNPSEGDTVIYTVTVTNNGPLDATNVSVTDLLPTGLTYSDDDAAASGTTYDSASGLWAVGTLATDRLRHCRSRRRSTRGRVAARSPTRQV